MAKHVFVIVNEPPTGAEAEPFERWYVDRHIPDVLAVPGVMKAQRFRLAPDRASPDGAPRFMTIYEIETSDRPALIAEIARRAGTDQMPLYPGAASGTHISYWGEAQTGEIFADASRSEC